MTTDDDCDEAVTMMRTTVKMPRIMTTDDDCDEAVTMMRTTVKMPRMPIVLRGGHTSFGLHTRMSRILLAACEAVLIGIAWVLLGIDRVLLRLGIDLHDPPPDEDY